MGGLQILGNLPADCNSFLHRQRRLADAFGQRFAFHKFHGEEALPVRLLQAVDRCDIRRAKKPDPGTQFGRIMLLGSGKSPEVYISLFIGSWATEILERLPGAFVSQFYLSSGFGCLWGVKKMTVLISRSYQALKLTISYILG